MGTFLKLISVENTKLWKRLSTKIMILILIAVTVGVLGLVRAEQNVIKTANNAENPTQSQSQSLSSNWKQELAAENVSLKQNVATMKKNKNQYEKNSIDSINLQIAKNQYYIDHNIKPDDSSKTEFWDVVTEGSMAQVVALLAIIACAALVAGEFSDGTMKTMISRPFKRWQILTAKFIVVFIYTLLLTVIAYIVELASVAVFFGTDGLNAMKFMWIGGAVSYIPAGVLSLIQTGLDFLTVLVYVVIAFMLSAMFRSRSLATGFSIFLLFIGSLAVLLGMYFNWGKLILFADTSFSTIITTGAPFYGLTLAFALIVSAVYCAVFLFAGYFTFAKRDIS